MKKISFKVLTSGILSLLLLSGCGNESSTGGSLPEGETTPPTQNVEENGTKTITDMNGTEVEVPAEVNSVINLFPSNNQIMILLGATDKQVAYTSKIRTPGFRWMQIINPDILEKPAVGLEGSVTAEELLLYNPDFVITPTQTDAETYREAGLATAMMLFNDMDGLKHVITNLATALGGTAPERADKYLTYLDGNIQLVQERLADVKEEDKPVVHYVDGQSGSTAFLTSGTETFQEEWLTLAGGRLATKDLFKGMSKEITPEQLLTLDPDYILVGGHKQAVATEALLNDPSLQGLQAVQNDKVIRIPQGTFQWDRFSSEVALQILWTAKTLYPDLFEDIDMKEETINFYKEFLDYDLSSEYADAILAGKDSPEGK